MNYKLSFSEMERLAQKTDSKKSKFSLEDMRKQVAQLKGNSISKEKKRQISYFRIPGEAFL